MEVRPLIIHDPKELDKGNHLLYQLAQQKVKKPFAIWPGVTGGNAHKHCVKYAIGHDWPYVIIIEDNIKFTHQHSWAVFYNYLLTLHNTTGFKMFFGGVYDADARPSSFSYLLRLKSFTGTYLYAVDQSAYQIILDCPDYMPMDKYLSEHEVEKLCCLKMVAFDRGKKPNHEFIYRGED